MRPFLQTALTVAAMAFVIPVSAQVVLFENDNFSGRSLTADAAMGSLDRAGFNDRASSAVVRRDRWELCEDAGFHGRCVVLAPGRYASLSAMGLNDRISSVRRFDGEDRGDERRAGYRDDHDDHDGPQMVDAGPPPGRPEYHRHAHERLFEAPVTAVRAVVGNPGQRCWVERERVDAGPDHRPGATIAGAVLGGIIGHQLGGGFGKDLATAGGAVAGAAIGNHLADDGDRSSIRPVQHCEGTPGPMRPDYWDVSYRWRGVEHRVQMTAPPGRTITVNQLGEPRD